VEVWKIGTLSIAGGEGGELWVGKQVWNSLSTPHWQRWRFLLSTEHVLLHTGPPVSGGFRG